tara:strand:- start:10536 stop:10775 length:240 start_codon:yes stop_codon:yes gene_type:complete
MNVAVNLPDHIDGMNYTPEMIGKPRDKLTVEAKHPEPTDVFEGAPRSDVKPNKHKDSYLDKFNKTSKRQAKEWKKKKGL